MKKILSIVAACLALTTGSAFAQPFWVGSVFNNSLGANVGGVEGFDWSSSGSGVAVGRGPFGNAAALTPGSSFDLFYQARLVGLTDTSGGAIAFPGLNTDFEYTVVAKFPETVAALVPLGGGLFTAAFSTLPGGTFFLFNDGAPNSVVGTGVGFDDGTLVASGTINPGQISTFTTVSSSTGVGSGIIEGLVDFANPAFLDIASIIFDFRFEGTFNFPPLDSTTSAFFGSRPLEGVYATYTVDTVGGGLPGDPVDLLLKIDGSSKFSVIPEPSTFLLLGAGLLGVAGFARKRMVK